MKIVSWNVNGLRAALNKNLRGFVSREKPDVLLLQEIKLQHKHIEEFSGLFRSFDQQLITAEKKGYSGVASFVKNPLQQNFEIGLLPEERFNVEARVLLTRVEDLNIVNVYVPSGTSGDSRQQFKYEFLDAFEDFCRTFIKKKKPRLLVGGDFNICHRAIDIHHPEVATKKALTGFLPEERAWLDRFLELGFVDTFRFVHGDIRDRYSWWSYRAGARKKNLGWRIDYLFASSDLAANITNAKILSRVSGSDHCPISVEVH